MKFIAISLSIIIIFSLLSTSLERKIKNTKGKSKTKAKEIQLIYKDDNNKELKYTLTEKNYESLDEKNIDTYAKDLPDCLGKLKMELLKTVIAEKQRRPLDKFMDSIYHLLKVSHDDKCQFSHFIVDGDKKESLIQKNNVKVKEEDVTDCKNKKCIKEEERLKKVLEGIKKEKKCPPEPEPDCSKCQKINDLKNILHDLEIEYKKKICPPDPIPDCSKCEKIKEIEKKIGNQKEINKKLEENMPKPKIIEVKCPEGCCEQKKNGNKDNLPYNLINENQVIAKLYIYSQTEESYRILDIWKDGFIHFKLLEKIKTTPSFITYEENKNDEEKGFFRYKIEGAQRNKDSFRKKKHNGMYLEHNKNQKNIDSEIALNTIDREKIKKFFWPFLSYLGKNEKEKSDMIDIFCS